MVRQSDEYAQRNSEGSDYPHPQKRKEYLGKSFWIEHEKIFYLRSPYFAKIPVWDKNPEEIAAEQDSKK